MQRISPACGITLLILITAANSQTFTVTRSNAAYHPSHKFSPAGLMAVENFKGTASGQYIVVEGYIDCLGSTWPEKDGDYHFELQSTNAKRGPGVSPDGLVCEIDLLPQRLHCGVVGRGSGVGRDRGAGGGLVGVGGGGVGVPNGGVGVGVGVRVGVTVAVGVGVIGGVGLGVGRSHVTSISSTLQPSPEPLESLAMRQRRTKGFPGIAKLSSISVSIKPPELPVHAWRPASGLPQQVLIVPL
jgi:hypothetical protein